jgi:hypothetical protein
MLLRLAEFEQNKLSLHDAAGDLNTLLSVIEEMDEAWQGECHSLWAEMEVEDSVAIVNHNGVMSEEGMRRMREVAAKMKELVLQKIEEPPDPS